MLNQKSVEKNLVIKLSVVGLLAIFIFYILQIVDYSLVHTVKITDIAAEGQLEWQIDMIKIDTHYIAITGWAFTPDQEPANLAISIVLQDTSTEATIELPTALVERDDINDHYGDGIDYSKCGFLSRLNKRFLDLDNRSYDIYIKLVSHNQPIFIQTNQVLSSQGD